MEQGLTYCRPEKKNIGKLQRTSGKYCSVCRHKIRGKNHINGEHHQKVERQKGD